MKSFNFAIAKRKRACLIALKTTDNVMIYTILVILLVMLAPDVALFMTMPAEWPVEMRALVFVPTAVSVLVFLLALSHKIGYPRSLRWFFFLLLVLALPKCVFAMVGIPLGVTWGLVAAGVVLLAVLAGYTWGWRHLVVREVEMSWPTLPPEFDGYRVTLFSDLHMGTIAYHPNFVKRVIGKVNDQRADLIVFGGDLVNRRSSEAVPFKAALARLRARDGVISVLGNHDYADYIDTDSAARVADVAALVALQRSLGWNVLRHEHITLNRGNQHIVIAGDENYGHGPHPDYSDLAATLTGVNSGEFTILLQHDPRQWRQDVVKATPVDLMLSGHTHAMQCIVSVAGHRFSPACIADREWGGFYAEGRQQLHVNTGLGMVGTPMRLGATPAITVITLSRNPNQ